MIEIRLDNDVMKVDGNFVIAWSSTLDFTVERSGKSLIGSAASGEGLVNVYRGTGKVLMMPNGQYAQYLKKRRDPVQFVDPAVFSISVIPSYPENPALF